MIMLVIINRKVLDERDNLLSAKNRKYITGYEKKGDIITFEYRKFLLQ